MRLLVRLVVVLFALGLVAEMAAPSLVEARVEDRVRQRTRGAVGVSAEVDSFPLLTRLLLTGEIRRMSVVLETVSRNRLQFSTVTYELQGVEIDREAALRQRTRIRDVERGRILAVLEASDLAAGFGIPIDLAPGDVEVSVAGRRLQIREGALDEIAESLPRDILPCDAESRVDDGRIVIECVFTDVPPVLLRAAEQATLG